MSAALLNSNHRNLPNELQDPFNIGLEERVQGEHILLREHGITCEVLNDLGNQNQCSIDPRPSILTWLRYRGRLNNGRTDKSQECDPSHANMRSGSISAETCGCAHGDMVKNFSQRPK